MKKRLLLFVVLVTMMTPRGSAICGMPDCTESLPSVFRRVSPSVVSVSAISFDPFAISDRVGVSSGSGFIIDSAGLVLTNEHLVYEYRTITVTLPDRQILEAELVGRDSILDLAVLRIPAPAGGFSPVATLGDSKKTEVGEQVLAIGNPLGLEHSLTVGVVSAINRSFPSAPMGLRVPLIQTDAAINPGNSGGPLINRCGEVIGINTAMLVDAENVGFAVPIHIAKDVLPQLLEHGRVIRPWVGVAGQLIGKDLGKIINLPLVDGFLVETVEPGSPADQAGLKGGILPITVAGMELLLGGDIITAANDHPLGEPEDFTDFIDSLKVGDRVRFVFLRNGKTKEVEFSLPERPGD
jgi:serine protease Do